MKTQKLLEKAKIGLILTEPFFASAALQMVYEEDETIETAKTNGKRIAYNPAFFTGLPQEERKGLIAHEIMHTLLGHPLRMKDRDSKVWNKACDYAINPLLQESGIKLPAGALLDSKFTAMSAEEIYKILIQDSNSKDQGKEYGEVEEPDETEDIKEMEQECKQMLIEASNNAKQAGKGISASIKEIIQELIEPKQNWKELLNRFFSEFAKDDYSWIRPNPRYLPSGMYLPVLESLEIIKLVFIMDTSSSMDREKLKSIIAEMKEAMSVFNISVIVIHCDLKVQKVEELTQDDEIVPEGRGGTQFQPAFDYVNENLEDTKAIVYFTDGGSWGKFTEPYCPVLWAIYNNKHFNPGFGEVIYVK